MLAMARMERAIVARVARPMRGEKTKRRTMATMGVSAEAAVSASLWASTSSVSELL